MRISLDATIVFLWVQEYINNKSTEGTNSHSGLALATECVLSFAALNSTSDSLAQPYLATRSPVLGSFRQI